MAFMGFSVWSVCLADYQQFIGASERATYLTTDLALLSPLDAVQGPAERSLGVSDPFSHTGGPLGTLLYSPTIEASGPRLHYEACPERSERGGSRPFRAAGGRHGGYPPRPQSL